MGATLQWEVEERCRAAGLQLAATGPGSFVVGTNHLRLLSWAQLLATLRDAVAADPRVGSDVQQLAGLCDRFESEGFIPLTREDIDDLDVPRRVIALADLVEDITTAAVKEDLLSVKGLKATHFAKASGRYVAFDRAGCWLGLNHVQWASHGRSPMWLRFDRGQWGRADLVREALKGWLSSDPRRAFCDEAHGAVRVPLLLRTGVEKQDVVVNVVAQLRELSELLAAADVPRLSGDPPPAGSRWSTRN